MLSTPLELTVPCTESFVRYGARRVELDRRSKGDWLCGRLASYGYATLLHSPQKGPVDNGSVEGTPAYQHIANDCREPSTLSAIADTRPLWSAISNNKRMWLSANERFELEPTGTPERDRNTRTFGTLHCRVLLLIGFVPLIVGEVVLVKGFVLLFQEQ
jgi:hypothetical protein